jgi:hypothetical protein
MKQARPLEINWATEMRTGLSRALKRAESLFREKPDMKQRILSAMGE